MEEPLLASAQIQANIVPGFQLPFQKLIALSVDGHQQAARLIRQLLPAITPMIVAHVFHKQRIERARAARIFGIRSFQNAQDSVAWLNVGIGARLLSEMGQASPTRADRSFQLGQSARSCFLGDPKRPETEGHKSRWRVGGDRTADMLLIVGSNYEASLMENTGNILALCKELGVEVIYQELGKRLEGDREHFGFKDGVSQPGVRGLISQQPLEYLTPRHVLNKETGPEYSSPGQELVWTGEFVFGYPRQSPNHYREPLTPYECDDFLKNGSFLVFRRLKQDVAGFRADTSAMTDELRRTQGFEHYTVDTVRAKLLGRWQNGAPLVRYPDQAPTDDDVASSSWNYFNFKADASGLELSQGGLVPGTEADSNGLKCPMHAHIRKVNPRDLGTDQGADTNTLTMRILRRGIPFGEPFDPIRPDSNERGLLFLCYQTSIRQQFERLVNRWVNSTINPEENKGFDMILGQNGEADGSRWCIFENAQSQSKSVSTMNAWVIPTGGGYFFCPSIEALSKLAES